MTVVGNVAKQYRRSNAADDTEYLVHDFDAPPVLDDEPPPDARRDFSAAACGAIVVCLLSFCY